MSDALQTKFRIGPDDISPGVIGRDARELRKTGFVIHPGGKEAA